MLRLLGCRTVGLVLLVLLMLEAQPHARADDVAAGTDAESERAYTTAISRGLQEYQLGHWNEACAYFRQAHGLRPSARTSRGLALCLYESRSYVESLQYMDRALSDQVLHLTAEMRADLETLREQALLFVSRLYVSAEPVQAELQIDQTVVSREQDGSIILDPGEHELTLSATAYKPISRTVRTRSGEAQRLTFTLEPLTTVARLEAAPATVAAPAPATRPSEPTRATGSMLPWIVIGSSGAVLLAGAVMLGVAATDKAAVENPDTTHWPDVSSRYDRARVLFPVGFTLAGVGLAGLATGIAMKLWSSAPGREHAAAHLTLGPGVVTIKLALQPHM